jgi:hypothetical protein
MLQRTNLDPQSLFQWDVVEEQKEVLPTMTIMYIDERSNQSYI